MKAPSPYKLLAVLAVLMLLDGLISIYICKQFLDAEANPLLRKLIHHMGPWVLVPVKLFQAGFVVCWALSALRRPEARRWLDFVLGFGIGYYAMMIMQWCLYIEVLW